MLSYRVKMAAVLGVAAIFASVVPASGQDVPSVSVMPEDPDPDGPNQGQWFYMEVDRGGAATTVAAVTNVANQPQTVQLSLQDLVFNEEGTPAIPPGDPIDIGAWGTLETTSLRLDAGATELVSFTITVPGDAEPGDHIGAFVAETSNPQGDFHVSRRIAKRVYVTVPGDARRSMAITRMDAQPDVILWPSHLATTTVLHNDGRIRLRPTVTIGGVPAQGAELILSKSYEQYTGHVPVPWYGGPVKVRVNAEADGGLVRTAARTVWVIPWGLIILVVVAASAVYAGRRWWKKRKSATAELKQDIQRLEQLITQQAKAQESTTAIGTGLPAADDVPEDEEAIILAALKRARRSDDDTALARIALAKHMTSGDGLDLVLEALEEHDGKHRDALLDAAVSYGADALSTHERFGGLPEQTQTELGERLVTAGETASGNGNGKPAKVPQPVVGQTDSDVLRTELAKVKGVGPAKQEALVSRFGSLDAIRAAEVEDLTDVPGIGYATAREILDQLNG